MAFFDRFKETIASLLCQQPDDDEDAEPHVSSTWCIYVDTLGCKVFKRPFYLHFDSPGEGKDWASTMMGMEYAISEPFFCESPENAAKAYAASGAKWMYHPEQKDVTA